MKKYVLFNDRDIAIRYAKNLLKFTAPILAIFFAQLANGVDVRKAGLVAMFALYGAIADAMKKIAEDK